MDSTTNEADPLSAITAMLREFGKQAERGELTALLIGFVRKDGAAAVQSSPMTAITLNHLSMLLQRRVARSYDRALAASEAPRSPTGAMRTHSPKTPEVQLPRKVRRAVKAKQRKLQKKAVKQAKLNGPPLPPETIT
jgi:hypothetical protein